MSGPFYRNEEEGHIDTVNDSEEEIETKQGALLHDDLPFRAGPFAAEDEEE